MGYGEENSVKPGDLEPTGPCKFMAINGRAARCCNSTYGNTPKGTCMFLPGSSPTGSRDEGGCLACLSCCEVCEKYEHCLNMKPTKCSKCGTRCCEECVQDRECKPVCTNCLKLENTPAA